ncbi:unnamed protein product [Linum tenue]|uniref:Aquaporin n=1 Tax=Linum tenue TaxID=586396 RepID=A0AAV0GVE5_9ROSI|nr:unnamed protein product [Linum tenue]
MWRAAVTEMVATACLVFALTTTLISCFESGQTDPKLLVPVSIFISGFPLLLATIPLTGGHMNPVFTLAVALKGGVSIARAVAYFVAQCLGSLIAFAVVKATMDGATAEKYQLGGCAVNGGGSGVGGGPGSGVGAGTALALEFTCTFVLLYVSMPIFGRRRELGLPTMCAAVAVAYGLVVYVSITVTGRSGYSGVGLHPARCWAAAVLFKGPLWEAHWVFWLGPFLACLVYHAFSLALPREELEKGDEHEEEHSGRQVDKFGSDVLKDFEVSGF